MEEVVNYLYSYVNLILDNVWHSVKLANKHNAMVNMILI
jgi:hypothetical protein